MYIGASNTVILYVWVCFIIGWCVLSREETSTQDSNETHRRVCSGAYVVQHHPDLNTYSLSAVTESGTTAESLKADVQELRRAILQNTTLVKVSRGVYSTVWSKRLTSHV